MTFEELNEVRNLKSFLADEELRLQALRDCAVSITQQFKRESYLDEQGKLQSFTALDDTPKSSSTGSRVENNIVTIVDAERNLEKLKSRLEEVKLRLTEKICKEFQESIEQAVLLYRYVSCRSFVEISHLTHYCATFTGFTKD